ncbi:hypothetical protein K227x_37390 [Rubripirellula lacrimiformis]|uniref:Uncharacterized protein n=1 Tax=Rubripirellula lacrimiformis TaxID=1930273 RepID=A0A517NDY4_9BACT|nr:hypothetical protein K227x_37390 [Rubripirellula lacrimiformis]
MITTIGPPRDEWVAAIGCDVDLRPSHPNQNAILERPRSTTDDRTADDRTADVAKRNDPQNVCSPIWTLQHSATDRRHRAAIHGMEDRVDRLSACQIHDRFSSLSANRIVVLIQTGSPPSDGRGTFRLGRCRPG